jgi:hypothetical protein
LYHNLGECREAIYIKGKQIAGAEMILMKMKSFYKLGLILMLVYSLLAWDFGTVTRTANAAGSAFTPIHDTFNDGKLPAGWTVQPPSNDPGTTATVENGKLKIVNSGNGNLINLKRAVNSGKLTGKVLFEYKLDVQKNSRYNLCMPALFSDASNFVSASQLLMVEDSMTVSSGSGDQSVSLKTIEGHSYKISYLLDYDKKTFDFLINDLTDGTSYSKDGAAFKNTAADQLDSVDFWIGSTQGNPGAYQFDDLTLEPYSDNVTVPIDDLADVKQKIGQAVVFMEGSPIVYAAGQRKLIDIRDHIPYANSGETYVPSSFLLLSSPSSDMETLSGLAASGKTIYHDGSGLIVVSDAAVFDPAADASLIQRTASLFGLYVSPNGNDNGPGTFTQPFQTIDRARQTIADMKNGKGLPIDGVIVYLRGGDYRQTQSVHFDAGDSGTPDSPIVYTSYPGEQAHINGSVSLDGNAATAVTDPGILARLPDKSRDKVVQIDLKAHGIMDYGSITPSNPFTANTYSYPELFLGGKRQILSRWPNEGFAYTGAIVDKNQSSTTFQFPGDRMTRWTTANDVWFQGLWTWDWYDDSLRLLSMDASKMTVTVNNPAWGVSKGKPFYTFNLLEEIDAMSEWYLDRTTGILYFYPPYSLKDTDLKLSMLTAPLISLDGTRNVSFERLTVEESRGTGISMNHTTNVRVAGSTLRNLGQQAVVVNGGQNSGVLSCDIYEINKGGVQLNGGDLNTLTYGNNYVENSNLYRTSLLNRTNVQPILVTGVGNRVSNNMLHDVPHQALGYDGNEHLFENNEVFNVLKETGDAGAFYTAQSWNYYNDTIRNNVFHDIKGPGSDDTYSVYLDGSISGQNVLGNLFFNVAKPILINGGRDNKVQNNVILNSRYSILGYDYSNDQADLPSMIQYQKLMQVPYNTGIWAEKYPLLANILNDQPTYPKYNVVTDNYIYNSGNISLHQHFDQYGTISGNVSQSQAPAFTDLKDLDGLHGLQTSKMGLQPDTFRQELPPVGDFRLTYPQQGTADVQANRVPFSWTRADGADEYRLIVATDPQMQHVVADQTVQDTKFMVRNLQYGSQTYYWKVEARSGSVIVKAANWNGDGVFSFTTSDKEIVDSSDLLKALQTASTLYDSAVEGTGSGQYAPGAKAALHDAIAHAEVLVATPAATQDDIDAEVTLLNDAVAAFQRQKNPEDLFFADIIPDLGNWVTSDRSTLHLSQDGKKLLYQSKSDDIVAGYKNIFRNNQILKFAAKFDLSKGWQGFGFRAATPDVVAWAGTSYLIVLSTSNIELHRFGTKNADVAVVPNTFVKDGVNYDVELSAFDEADGVHIVFKLDGVEVFNVTDRDHFISEEGCFVLYDAGGRGIEISSADEKSPVTRAEITPPQPDGLNGWYLHSPVVTLSAADTLSGFASTEYSLDGGTSWKPFTGPITVNPEGRQIMSYRSTDRAGNVETAKTLSINLDTMAPSIAVSAPIANGAYEDADDLTPQWTASDLVSGVDDGKTIVTLDGQSVAAGMKIPLYTLPLGEHKLTVNATDLAGNKKSETTAFRTVATLGSLKRLITRFADIGWIDNSGIANSLQQKLDNGQLEALIQEISAQSDKHITKEAADYLLRDARAIQP